MIGEGRGLRPWVYYAKSTGFFRRLHRASGSILLAVFLVAPWIRLGEAPLLRVDLADRRLHVLGQLFTALDARFLLVLGLGAAIGLGLVTSVAGRVWCGYACPQTVFLEEIIRRIETAIEGDRGARRRLDEGPWTPGKVAKKSLKWSLFALVSVVLAFSFLSYFAAPQDVWLGRASTALYGVAAVIAGLLFFDLAWFREQFCNYLCPYARIQGALTDRHSLVIGYHPARGEPRLGVDGATKKLVITRGGCVDCGKCVQVCPQGIDIRNGYQLECIACGHCVDACTSVMGKLGHPSLITYTTEAKLTGEARSGVRLRPLVYVGILVVIGGLGLFGLAGRETFDAQITRIVGSTFTPLADGRTQNAYNGHFWNNATQDRAISIRVEGIDGAEVVAPQNPVHVAPGRDSILPVFVIVPSGGVTERSTRFEFVFESEGGEVRRPGTFLANPGAS